MSVHAKPFAGAVCIGPGLLSPAQALAAILGDIEPTRDVETIPLLAAAGRITAAEALSPIALPRFDNAAMDGFAVHSDDIATEGPIRLKLAGSVAAGDGPTILGRGETRAINTGAWIPKGTGAIIERERASIIDGHLILNAPPNIGRNMRRAGEDIGRNDSLVAAGTILDERHIALLAACGIAHVTVRRRLRIGILSTGNEIAPHGAHLAPGQTVDVNRRMLAALVGFAGTVRDLGIAKDTLPELAAHLSHAAELDLLITSGGVAGSDADLVPQAVSTLGGTTTTMKLALKPGKPVGFSWLRSCIAVHLAGNPMAALAGGLLFARPLAGKMMGAIAGPQPQPAYFADTVRHRAGRTELLPARIVRHDKDGRTILAALGRGGSANLHPLAAADGMAEIAADLDDVQPDQKITFHSFAAGPFAPRQSLWHAA